MLSLRPAAGGSRHDAASLLGSQDEVGRADGDVAQELDLEIGLGGRDCGVLIGVRLDQRGPALDWGVALGMPAVRR